MTQNSDEERITVLRQAWNKSERILNILRTQSGETLEPVTDEYLEQWLKRINQNRLARSNSG